MTTATIDLEALITAAYEAREAEQRREREEVARRVRDHQEQCTRQYREYLDQEMSSDLQAALAIRVEYDALKARGHFDRYGEVFSLDYRGQEGWRVFCATASVDDAGFPVDITLEPAQLTSGLLAYLGDVRHYVAALSAHEHAAQSADQARHDQEDNR